jgi:hypothetical protein
MNIMEYRQSGIIEDYCLGLLSEDEMREVAKNAKDHGEIRKAIEEFEAALKRYAKDWVMNIVTSKNKTSFPEGNSVTDAG